MSTESPSNMPSTKDQQKDAQDAKSHPNQEQNVAEKPAKEKSSKPRHRASVACASCRDRRIRVSRA
jgi:hypothetical protein